MDEIESINLNLTPPYANYQFNYSQSVNTVNTCRLE